MLTKTILVSLALAITGFCAPLENPLENPLDIPDIPLVRDYPKPQEPLAPTTMEEWCNPKSMRQEWKDVRQEAMESAIATAESWVPMPLNLSTCKMVFARDLVEHAKVCEPFLCADWQECMAEPEELRPPWMGEPEELGSPLTPYLGTDVVGGDLAVMLG